MLLQKSKDIDNILILQITFDLTEMILLGNSENYKS
jgi:hypothetical protein